MDSIIWRMSRERHHDIRVWEGEAVVYDTLTGDTHLLDPYATQIVQVLTQLSQATAESLSRRLGPEFEVATEEGLLPHTLAVLESLRDLRIIEAAPS